MSSVDVRQEGPRVRESESPSERERDDHATSCSLSTVEPDNELEEGTGDSGVLIAKVLYIEVMFALVWERQGIGIING